MIRFPVLLLGSLLAASACTKRAVQVPAPRYVVGAGYQAGGVWFYPREDLHYDASGIAAVQTAGSGGLTANGEAVERGAVTAAHPTLQLPAVARVTNLETGAQILLRINDRGPADPSRLIALSPRAAELLGVRGPTRVRVVVDEGMSAGLRDQLDGGPKLTVAAAPRGAVMQETLAPPPGAVVSARQRGGPGARVIEASAAPEMRVPDRLPETVMSTVPAPGRLMIRAGSFAQPGYARELQARLSGIGARVETLRELRGARYDVVAGPFATILQADTALAQALRVTPDARIGVE